MPTIGERRTIKNAFTVEAHASGGMDPTTDNPPPEEYFPDDGWVIIDYKTHEETRRGDATFNVGYKPAGYRIINTDDIEGRFKGRVEWQYAQVWGKANWDTKWKNTRTQIEEYQKLTRRIVGSARARGERFGAGASIRVRVEAIIEYVGTAADADQYVNQILNSISLPKFYYFSPRWNGAHTGIKIEHKKTGNSEWNYEAYFSNNDINSTVNMVYQGHAKLPPGTYTFKPTLRTEGAARNVEISIVEGSGLNTLTYTLSSNSQALQVSYTKQKGIESDIYTTITWRDNRSEPIILDGSFTFLDHP